MKTIPPPCPEPETGPKYWRSLDEVAETPEFRQWMEREFPQNASEWTDPVSRRHFVKIMSASFLLAGFGVTGCRRPEEHIMPFGQSPEHYIHGVPQFYATAMPNRHGALPLLVKSHDGRPTKIEGNPDHPASQGATDVFAQASILNLYDPDRAKRFARNGASVPREAALEFLGEVSRRAEGSGGRGLSFLMEASGSPSRRRLQEEISARLPNARWHVYEPIDLDANAKAAAQLTGRAASPYYRLDRARVILSLDCDFIGSEQESVRYIRDFINGRRVRGPEDGVNRLYAVEGLMTLTGFNADHRLRLPTGTVAAIAAVVAQNIVPGNALISRLAEGVELSDAQRRWAAECADDLAANRGACLVMAGYRQPPEVHAAAHALNSALGNIGQTVFFQQTALMPARDIRELAQSLDAGEVETLVILGGNPAYNAPFDLKWAEAQGKARTVIRLGYYADETSWHPRLYRTDVEKPEQWDLAAAHYLESWGDVRTSDGTLAPVQPLIAPLFGGVTELEVLARLGGLSRTNPHDIVRDTFLALSNGGEEEWKKFLHDGFLSDSAAKPDEAASILPENVDRILQEARQIPAATAQSLEVVFYRDARVDDGRYNNNGWLQEMPDPVTKMTWDNVILISERTAHELGFQVRDEEKGKLEVPVARLELHGQTIEGPLWIQPGLADNTVALALGYGRSRTGRIGHAVGYDAYVLRTSNEMYVAAGGKLSRTDRTHRLATTQNHWAMEGRPIVREANLATYRQHPDFPRRMDMEEPRNSNPLYPNPLDRLEQTAGHHWGMSIDLTACVGCSACVMACQSENNVPIVGKEQVAKGREMHWLRIDRYYAGTVIDPQVVTQPMLCQHCEAAPCESVCPVNATVHDKEGLNLMIYNRCVGTRYCSNNCPYKVRRFNYFDYNRRPLNELYKSPFTSVTDGEWELKRWVKEPAKGSKAEDEWELLKMLRNPDVTVRMRGVMEKCTFCVQRIEAAKIAQKVQARNSGDIAVPDGAIKMACQQACPADAIVFGDISDPNARVSKLKKQQRDYTVLEFLATKPRLTYLARIRNPNEKMPDYYEQPLTVAEYAAKHSDPFGVEKAGHGSGDGSEKGGAH